MLVVLSSEQVEAQAWLEDRKRTEGHGIRLGDFELHPGLGTEVGYDSNLFLDNEDAKNSVLLRISPHLFLSTLGEERRGDDSATPPVVNFRVGGASSFYHYFYSKDLDDFSVGADLNLTLNPDRPVSFTVNESFTRNIRPFTEAPTEQAQEAYDYARNRNNLGGLLMFATKSGLFKGGLGFDWGADWFEEDVFSDKDSFTYSPNAKTSWQFLPMTALLYDIRVDFQNYLNPQTSDSSSRVDDNARIASRIGVNGVLTTTISMTMLLGYAAGFYDAFEEYDDIIGQIEARWRASHSFTLKLGYDRSFESALQGNFCRRDRGYASALLLMGGAFLLDLELWAGLLQYGVPRAATIH